jgi:hypothetical protein
MIRYPATALMHCSRELLLSPTHPLDDSLHYVWPDSPVSCINAKLKHSKCIFCARDILKPFIHVHCFMLGSGMIVSSSSMFWEKCLRTSMIQITNKGWLVATTFSMIWPGAPQRPRLENIQDRTGSRLLSDEKGTCKLCCWTQSRLDMS